MQTGAAPFFTAETERGRPERGAHFVSSERLAIQFLIFPMVPMTTWLVMTGIRPTPAVAVSVQSIPLYFAILDSTETFCMTSSRVGQMHSACGFCTLGSTRESIPRTKHVVLPLPFFACGFREAECGVRSREGRRHQAARERESAEQQRRSSGCSPRSAFAPRTDERVHGHGAPSRATGDGRATCLSDEVPERRREDHRERLSLDLGRPLEAHLRVQALEQLCAEAELLERLCADVGGVALRHVLRRDGGCVRGKG